MDLLLSRYRNVAVLLVVIVSQLFFLAYQVKNNQDVPLLRVLSVGVVTPLANVLEFVRRNTIGVAQDYFVLIHVRDENQQMKQENGKLKMENQYLRTELQTADRAEALRAFQYRTPSQTLAARVIGNGAGTNTIVFIDRGSSSGIEKGMAVVTPDGIVGKVLSSYPTASMVQLITDATFAAGVISEKNRVQGTLKGTGQSKCQVEYVQNEEKVDVGEMFYTSGADRIFPKGMPVGRATVVRDGPLRKEIYVEPSGAQGGLEEVLVVIEGVHQAIPEVSAMVNQPVHLQGDAPPEKDFSGGPSLGTLMTEADRTKERYKKIGEAQGHQFGEATPRPPNFNINPDTVKPPPPQQPTAPPASSGSPAAHATVSPNLIKTPAQPAGAGTHAAGGLAVPPVRPTRAPGGVLTNTVRTSVPGESTRPLDGSAPRAATGAGATRPATATGPAATRPATANPFEAADGTLPARPRPAVSTGTGAPGVNPTTANPTTANPLTANPPRLSGPPARSSAPAIKPPAAVPGDTTRPTLNRPANFELRHSTAADAAAASTVVSKPSQSTAPHRPPATAPLSTPASSKPPSGAPASGRLPANNPKPAHPPDPSVSRTPPPGL